MQNFAFFWRKFAHRCDLILKMMEHLKIHVQCKRHRLLFPTESQSHWLHWLGFLPVCAFSHSSHLFYVDYFKRSLEGVSPNIYKTTQLAHFGLLTTMVAFVCDISTVFLQMLSQIIHPRRWPMTLSAFTAPWCGHWCCGPPSSHHWSCWWGWSPQDPTSSLQLPHCPPSSPTRKTTMSVSSSSSISSSTLPTSMATGLISSSASTPAITYIHKDPKSKCSAASLR